MHKHLSVYPRNDRNETHSLSNIESAE